MAEGRLAVAGSAIGLGRRYPGGALMHLRVEQRVHSGDDQAVHHQGGCEDCKARWYAGIHEFSGIVLSRRLLRVNADEPRSAHRGRREPAAHDRRDERALAGASFLVAAAARDFCRAERAGRVTEAVVKLSREMTVVAKTAGVGDLAERRALAASLHLFTSVARPRAYPRVHIGLVLGHGNLDWYAAYRVGFIFIEVRNEERL
jgi:hypothetical protein